jgi:hypothetical protein
MVNQMDTTITKVGKTREEMLNEIRRLSSWQMRGRYSLKTKREG